MKNTNNPLADYLQRYQEGYNFGILPDKTDKGVNFATYKEINFPDIISEKIVYTTEKLHIPTSIIFKTIWGIVLQKYNNVNNVICFELNKNHEINLFRVKTNKNATMKSLLMSVQKKDIEKMVVNMSTLKQKSNSNKLSKYETLFVYRDNKNGENNGEFDWFAPLQICFCNQRNYFSFHLKYDTCKYSDELIKTISDYLVNVVHDFVTNPDRLISQVDCIPNKNKILFDFNNTYVSIAVNTNIVALFEERVKKHPNDIAIIFSNKSISFKELNNKVNQLTNRLIKLKISSGDLIPLYTQKSIEMIIGMLSILKAGGAYIPIDTANNLQYIIKECEPKAIILYNKKFDNIYNSAIVDLSHWDVFSNESIENINLKIGQDDLSCCLYTSGSTGSPKGVLINHIGLLNAILTNINIYSLSDKDTVLQFSNYTYAQSIIDIFTSLIIAKICLLSEKELKNISSIEKICNENRVTIMALTPSLISELCPEKFKTLRILDSTGEIANVNVLKKWIKYCTVINSYGSTELTGNTSVYVINGKETNLIPIGKPIYNNEYYIMDQNNHLCDVGMLGELYIAGTGLAKGYLNDSELTKNKFVVNPITGKRSFKTGDMARWLPDGNVEYLGRIDKQIKIHGIRINLDTIKRTINTLEDVKNCYITINNDNKGNKVICGYMIGEKKLDITAIREKLIKLLPLYMVPSYICQIEKIPLNKNAKIDIKALPKPQYIPESTLIAEPKTSKEKMLISILSDELSIKNISITNNFIELGGDSIKAIRVVSKLRNFNYELSVSNLLEAKSFESVAKEIKQNKQINTIKADEISADDLDIINKFFNLE